MKCFIIIFLCVLISIFFIINTKIVFSQDSENNSKENNSNEKKSEENKEKSNENDFDNDEFDNDSEKSQLDNLYIKAFVLENDKWEIRKAIKLYKEIIEKSNKKTRLKAKATFRLGVSYLKIKKLNQSKKYLKMVKTEYPIFKKINAQADFYLNKIKEVEDELNEKDREGLTDFLVYSGIVGMFIGMQTPNFFVEDPETLKAWPLLTGAIGAGAGVGAAYLFTMNEEITPAFGNLLTIGYFHGMFTYNIFSFLFLRPYVKNDGDVKDDWEKRGKFIGFSFVIGPVVSMLATYYAFKDEDLSQGEIYIIDSMQLWFMMIGGYTAFIIDKDADFFGDSSTSAGLALLTGMTVGTLGAALFNKFTDLTYNQAKTIGRATGAGTLAALMFLIYDPRSIISFSKLDRYSNRTKGWIMLGGTSLGLIASAIGIAIWGEDAVIKTEKKPKFQWEEEQNAVNISFLEPKFDVIASDLPNSDNKNNVNFLYGVSIFSINF